MDFGFFGKAFDFNFDGHLDGFERATDFAAFMNLMDQNAWQENADTNFFVAGLDWGELNMMDDWERREALEDAGLDPDDYDFDF